MWPERKEGVPYLEWVAGRGNAGGYYVLHADYPNLAGAVTNPGAQPGILAPYQERPQVHHPVELKLHIDPARNRGRLFPLLIALGTNPAATTSSALGSSPVLLNAGIAASYQAHTERYKRLLANSTTTETPDKALNEAFQWAVVCIEQLRANAQGTGETALVAGYYASGDSAALAWAGFLAATPSTAFMPRTAIATSRSQSPNWNSSFTANAQTERSCTSTRGLGSCLWSMAVQARA
jgi:hypothetical protein